MKKLFACLLALCLLLTSAAALAGPRYPEYTGNVTDAAAVLSPGVVSDIDKLNQRLESAADGLRLAVAAVDFLDGTDALTYAAGLWATWRLPETTILLVVAAGEDTWAVYTGPQVKLNPATVEKLVAAYAAPELLAQRYDEALIAMAPALANEAAKAYGSDISIAGLFGTEAAPAVTAAPAAGYQSRASREQASRPEVRYEYQSSSEGGNLIGALVILFIVFSIIGSRSGRARKRRMGCLPIAAFIAGVSLLWPRKRR